MPISLTQNQIKQFRLNGYLVLKNVLSSSEVDILADHCDLIASGRLRHVPESSIQLEPVFRDKGKPVSDQVLSVRKLSDLAVHDNIMWAHATNSKIVDVISDLLNTEDIKLYGDQLFMNNNRSVGDTNAGSGGTGVSEIVGGTGKYTGVKGSCTYTVTYLPGSRVAAINKCKWSK